MRRWFASLILAVAITNPSQLWFTANGSGAAKVTLANKLGDIVSVKDFGATGDGVTNDATKIQAAITAAANGTLLFPAGTYISNTTLTISSPITIRCNGSTISGDPGNNYLFSITASNVRITGCAIANTHVKVGSQTSYMVINAGGTTHPSSIIIDHNTFTAGLGVRFAGVQGGSVDHNTFTGMVNFAFTGNIADDIATPNNYLSVASNTISGTTTNGLNGPPHDINYEDTHQSEIVDNNVTDGSGMTEALASCIQIFPNHIAQLNHLKVRGNICVKSPVGTYPGMVASSVINDGELADNWFVGYSDGINWTENASSELIIKGNHVVNAQRYGMYFNAPGATSGHLLVEHNEVIGPGNVAGALDCYFFFDLNNGLLFTGNQGKLCGRSGLYLSAVSKATVVGNYLRNNGQNVSGDGISVGLAGQTSSNNIIVGNYISDDQGAPTQANGLNIGTGVSNFASGNFAVGNVTTQYTNAGTTTMLVNNDGIWDSRDGTVKAATFDRTTAGTLALGNGSATTINIGNSASTTAVKGASVNIGLSTSQTQLLGSFTTANNAIAQSTASMTLDAKLGATAIVTLTASVTGVTLSNFSVGQFYTVTFVQGGAGSFTVTGWPANVKWLPTAYRGTTHTAPTLTTTVGARDTLRFNFDGTNLIQVSENLNN